jgi:hypothetical protein
VIQILILNYEKSPADLQHEHIVRFLGACLAVLPRGRNFGRKSQKGPKKIVWSRENEGPNFWKIYQKRGEKGPTFF